MPVALASVFDPKTQPKRTAEDEAFAAARWWRERRRASERLAPGMVAGKKGGAAAPGGGGPPGAIWFRGCRSWNGQEIGRFGTW